jgi:hypothetical protein
MDHHPEPSIVLSIKALGEILASQNERAAIVVVGGAALIIQGFIERATRDIDIIAISHDVGDSEYKSIEPP